MTVRAKERHFDKHEKNNEAILFHRNKMHPESSACSAHISFVYINLKKKKSYKEQKNASQKKKKIKKQGILYCK